MKIEHVLCIGGGLIGGFVICRLLTKGEIPAPLDPSEKVLESGDKGKEVLDLQEAINMLSGNQIVNEDSLYSKKMIEHVNNAFEGTHALKYPERGGVNTRFVTDLRKVLSNLT